MYICNNGPAARLASSPAPRGQTWKPFQYLPTYLVCIYLSIHVLNISIDQCTKIYRRIYIQKLTGTPGVISSPSWSRRAANPDQVDKISPTSTMKRNTG